MADDPRARLVRAMEEQSLSVEALYEKLPPKMRERTTRSSLQRKIRGYTFKGEWTYQRLTIEEYAALERVLKLVAA